MSSDTFQRLLTEYEAALRWFEALGGSTAHSRFFRYLHSLRDLIRTRSTRDPLSVGRVPEIINAFLEASNFVHMYWIFSEPKYSAYVRERLQVVSGPQFYRDENASSSNRPRNLAFELTVASRFVAGGIELVDDIVSDVVLRTPANTILVECKRPSRIEAIERNYVDAARQLRKRFLQMGDPAVRGIVALDLSRAVNVKGSVLTVPRSEMLHDILIGKLTEILLSHHTVWAKRKDPRTIGVYVQIGTVAFAPLSNPSILNAQFCRLGKVAPNEEYGVADLLCLEQIQGAIEQCGLLFNHWSYLR